MIRTLHSASRWGAIEQELRTPTEIFAHQIEAIRAEDLEGVLIDYADDACLVTPAGVLRGKDAIRGFFAATFDLLPRAEWEVSSCFVDDLLFLEWTAESAKHFIPDGVNTFVFQDGLIRAQTARFTIVPKD